MAISKLVMSKFKGIEVVYLLLINSVLGLHSVSSSISRRQIRLFKTEIFGNFYDDFGEGSIGGDQDEDEDDYIDSNELGDWRKFRKNLSERGSPTDMEIDDNPLKPVSKENLDVLRSQSKSLADEYLKGIWAHEIAEPEVGGLVARLPLEVELYRNNKRSILGAKLQKQLNEGDRVALWYRKAQILCEKEIKRISQSAVGGQIDPLKLSDESMEFLRMYLENQETWQEVCLVVERDEKSGSTSALVLNRPMAFKLTRHLAQLVLEGSFSRTNVAKYGPYSDVQRFLMAFGNECAVYVGGPDEQHAPATIIHGFRDLDGAKEISPGANIYMGGVDAAIEGVLSGKYKPLDFRFFTGKHVFEKNTLEVECLLGKYQPIACARALALKQCISLPKPLWHEVLELCDGELKMISHLELVKRDDLKVEFDIEYDDSDDDILEIFDELDELSKFEEDEDNDNENYTA